MHKNYIVAGSPRVGSSLLCDLLEANHLGHPEEHFNATDFNKRFSRAVAAGVATEDYARLVFAEEKTKIFGTKLMWPWVDMMLANSRVHYRDHHEMLNAIFPKGKYVFVKRRDRIGQALSTVRALDTNEWQIIKDGEKIRRKKWDVEISTARVYKTIVANLYYDRHWESYLERNRVPHIVVIYEELISDTRSHLVRIGRFLAGDSFVVKTCASKLAVQRDAASDRARRVFLSQMNVLV